MTDTYEMLEARQLMEAGQYEDALAVLCKIPQKERNGAWYVFRGEIEDQLERYYDALHSLNQAVEIEPDNLTYKQQLKDYRKKLRGKGVLLPSEKKPKKGKLPSCCDKCCQNDCCTECGAEICCGMGCECFCESLSGC